MENKEYERVDVSFRDRWYEAGELERENLVRTLSVFGINKKELFAKGMSGTLLNSYLVDLADYIEHRRMT